MPLEMTKLGWFYHKSFNSFTYLIYFNYSVDLVMYSHSHMNGNSNVFVTSEYRKKAFIFSSFHKIFSLRQNSTRRWHPTRTMASRSSSPLGAGTILPAASTASWSTAPAPEGSSPNTSWNSFFSTTSMVWIWIGSTPSAGRWELINRFCNKTTFSS